MTIQQTIDFDRTTRTHLIDRIARRFTALSGFFAGRPDRDRSLTREELRLEHERRVAVERDRRDAYRRAMLTRVF